MDDGLKDLRSIPVEVDGGFRRIGKGLDVGTGLGKLDFGVGRFDVDDTGDEDILDPLLQEVEHMAMCRLDGKAGLGHNGFNPFSNELFIGGV